MAIWQVAFFLISKNRTTIECNSIFLHSLEELEKTFPEEKSWSKELRQYGNLDSTCIEISFYNSRIIEEIMLRIDVTNISTCQLKTICEFSNRNNLCMKYNDTLYEVNIENFSTILRKSNAYAFVTNPNNYFEELCCDKMIF